MRFQTLLSLATFAVGITAQNNSIPEPPAPGLTFLYTSYAECKNRLYTSQGPRGLRTAIPIIGGNFTGPRLRGPAALLGNLTIIIITTTTDTLNRRNLEPRSRLGPNRHANGHLQRRYAVQFPYARRREYSAADFWACAA
jgi:hypothetical protein